MFGPVPNHSGWADQDVRTSGVHASTVDGGWPQLSEGPADALTAKVRAEYAEALQALADYPSKYSKDPHFRYPYIRGYHEAQRETRAQASVPRTCPVADCGQCFARVTCPDSHLS